MLPRPPLCKAVRRIPKARCGRGWGSPHQSGFTERSVWGLLSGAEEWGSNYGVWQALHLPERRLSFGASPCESFHRPLGLCCTALLQPGCQKENCCA